MLDEILCPGSRTKSVQAKKANMTNRQNNSVYKICLDQFHFKFNV